MSNFKEYQAVIELLETNNIDNIWLAYYAAQTIDGFWQNFERQLLQVASQRDSYHRLDTVISASFIRDVLLVPSIVNGLKPVENGIKKHYGVDCRVGYDTYLNVMELNFTVAKGKLVAKVKVDINTFEVNPTWMGFCEGEDLDTFSIVVDCIKDLKKNPDFFKHCVTSIQEFATTHGFVEFLEKVMSIDHNRVEEEWRQHRWSKLLRQGKFTIGNPNAIYSYPINSLNVVSVEGKKAECEYTICTYNGSGRKRVYAGTKKIAKIVNVWSLYEKVKHLL
jgi:hypothetical protein